MAGDDEIARAEAQQRAIAARVEIPREPVAAPRTVAGLDVSYATGSDHVVAAAVVVDVVTGVVGLAAHYRVPDPIRRADHLSRQMLRG